MVLYTSSVLTVDYDPAEDTMEVAYSDLEEFMLSEIK
jgi:hypothetical protein